MPRRWTTPEGLAFEGEQTGDGRIFVPGAFSWDGDQWPLRYDAEDDGGHSGAVLVGAIDSLSRGDVTDDVTPIVSDGSLDTESDMGADVERLLDNGAPLGVSVDLDDLEVEWVVEAGDGEDDIILLAASFSTASYTRRQLRLVAGSDEVTEAVTVWAPGIGALHRSVFEDLGAPALTAAAGDGDLPEDDSVVLFTEATDDIIIRFTRARIRGATLVDIPAFDRAAIRLDPVDGEGADGQAAADDETLAALLSDARGRLADAVTAAGTHAVPMRPPAGWFDPPGWAATEVVEVTDPETGRVLRGVPMAYLPSGEVRGHIALWGQCHTGSPDGACVLTPSSRLAYVPFHHGQLELEDGTTVAVGNLTMGGGHADGRLSYAGAIEHYDNAGRIVAQVRAGEDEYGVWVHGAGMPDVWADELEMRRLRAASPSGDWRTVGGHLELTAALAVSHPGFPVPRAQVASGGEVVSLVAAGARDAVVLSRAASGPSGARLASIVQQAVQAGIDGYVRQQQAAAEAAARQPAVEALEGIRRERAVAALRG